MTTSSHVTSDTVRSLIPARIDRLPWSPFHNRIVVALGVAWILDGLEITVASAVVAVLNQPETLNLSSTAVGLMATVYLAGEVVGALVFGRMSDKLGRRNLFMLTLGVYLFGSGLTALTLGNGVGWIVFLYLTRFIAGMGIGGEYAAINSAIDELVPARYRGRVDIVVNGTYWAGAVLGTLGTFILLNVMDPSIGWRIGFLLGPVLGLVILLVRRNLPESPRWQVMNGRERAAEESLSYIESEVRKSGKVLPPVDESKAIELRPTDQIGYLALTRVLFREYPGRAVLGASLMISQSFLYNAIFFTYTLVLVKFYNVAPTSAPLFLIAFAVGNLLGPLTIGHLFDTIGRKTMISGTYIVSGILLGVSAFLFNAGLLTAMTQTIAWCVIFFFASAGASAAYLTVSEIFPLEVRAKAIAVFFAIAQCFGALGPVLYGALIGDGSQRFSLFLGYLLGALMMIAGGLVAVVFAVAAEQRSLEEIAAPLAATSRGRTGTTRAEGAASPRSTNHYTSVGTTAGNPSASGTAGSEQPRKEDIHQSTSTVIIYTSVDDGTIVRNAVLEMLQSLDYEVVVADEPEIGSVFQWLRVALSSDSTKDKLADLVSDIERGLELRYIAKQRSENDEREANAIAALLKATEPIPQVAIKLSSILFLKIDNQITVKVLNESEIRILDANPHLLKSPLELLDKLGDELNGI